MSDRCGLFFEAVLSILEPQLKQYGLSEASRRVESSSCFLRLANSTTGVEVSYEPFEGGSFVRVSILEDGSFPKYPIFIDEDTQLKTFDLQDIRAVRGESPFLDRAADVRQLAAAAAHALAESGENVLRGNFEELPKAREIVRNRARALRRGG